MRSIGRVEAPRWLSDESLKAAGARTSEPMEIFWGNPMPGTANGRGPGKRGCEVARDPGLARPQSSARLPTNDTLAVYIDGPEIIYLIEGWTGRTPADLSVLVHEMVHHFQYKLGFKHECPQDREKLAYAAQDRWLHLFGHSLESDFELDGFPVLVKTYCLH